jgi:O-antigen chain-terminating methyltransferase
LIFKDQREVNYNILEALEESVKINQKLLEQIKIINKNTEEDLISLKFVDSDLKDKYQQLVEKINYLEAKQENFSNSNEIKNSLTPIKINQKL